MYAGVQEEGMTNGGAAVEFPLWLWKRIKATGLLCQQTALFKPSWQHTRLIYYIVQPLKNYIKPRQIRQIDI